jgi:hypothetical protein
MLTNEVDDLVSRVRGDPAALQRVFL